MDLDMRRIMKGRPRALYAKLWESGGLRREDFLTLNEAAKMARLSRRQLREFLDVSGVQTLAAPDDMRKKLVPISAILELQRQRRLHERS